MADLLMAIGRHGTGPALALFITALATAYGWEGRKSHPLRSRHHPALGLMDKSDYLGKGSNQ